MNGLASARIGILLALACALPIVIWFGAFALGPPSAAGAEDAAQAALRGLWVVQASAVALATPRALGSSWANRLVGLALFLAVPLPLLCVAWLSAAADASSLLRGVGLFFAWAAGVASAARVVDLGIVDVELRRMASAALEVGLLALAVAFRHEWIGWTRL